MHRAQGMTEPVVSGGWINDGSQPELTKVTQPLKLIGRDYSFNKGESIEANKAMNWITNASLLQTL